MQWVFRWSDQSDVPQVLTLQEPPDQTSNGDASRVRFLPGGGLAIDVETAAEARGALLELQRRQRELLSARVAAAGGGIADAGGRVGKGVVGSGRRVLSFNGRVVRSLRPRRPARAGTQAISDTADVALLGAQLASGADDAIRLIGAAMRTIVDSVPEIDLSGIDLDLLDILDC
jgi:hypothetical protein